MGKYPTLRGGRWKHGGRCPDCPSMNYKKDKDNLIITIPLRQNRYNPYQEDMTGDGYTGTMNSLIGVIAGDDYTLNYLIDMDYKGKADQVGTDILHFDSREELEEICKECEIEIRELPVCSLCRKAIWGTFTVADKGKVCYDCNGYT